MRRTLGYVIGSVLTVGVLILLAAYYEPSRAAQQLPGLFDTTGGAAVSVGCAQWDVPMPSEKYDGDSQDFIIQADRDELLLIVVHQGHNYIISGKQCGVVLDWRRFPDKPRPEDFKQ